MFDSVTDFSKGTTSESIDLHLDPYLLTVLHPDNHGSTWPFRPELFRFIHGLLC